MQRSELSNSGTPRRSHQLVPVSHSFESSQNRLPTDASPRFSIFFWAGIITLFWLGGALGFFIGFYGAEGIRTLPLSNIIGFVSLLLIPVFLIWFLAAVIHFAIDLRRSSEHLSLIASRLMGPEMTAAEDIVQLRRSVRSQLDSLHSDVEVALSNAEKLEEDVHRHSDDLPQPATTAERHFEEVGSKLEGERDALKMPEQSQENKENESKESFTKQPESLQQGSEKTGAEIEGVDHQTQNRVEMPSDTATATLKSPTETEKQLNKQHIQGNEQPKSVSSQTRDFARHHEQQRASLNQTIERLDQENTTLESSLDNQRLVPGQIGDAAPDQDQGTIDERMASISSAIESACETATTDDVVQNTEQTLVEQIAAIAKHIKRASETASGADEKSGQPFVDHAGSSGDDIGQATAEDVTEGPQTELDAQNSTGDKVSGDSKLIQDNVVSAKSDTGTLKRDNGHSPSTNKSGWRWRDILAAADDQADRLGDSIPVSSTRSEDIPHTSLHIIETLQTLTVDLDRALEEDAPTELLRRYLNGERNLFAKRIVHCEREEMLQRIQSKYQTDQKFKNNTDRYLSQFEELLKNAQEEVRENTLTRTYLSSDTGKVYLLIAEALDRINQ